MAACDLHRVAGGRHHAADEQGHVLICEPQKVQGLPPPAPVVPGRDLHRHVVPEGRVQGGGGLHKHDDVLGFGVLIQPVIHHQVPGVDAGAHVPAGHHREAHQMEKQDVDHHQQQAQADKKVLQGPHVPPVQLFPLFSLFVCLRNFFSLIAGGIQDIPWRNGDLIFVLHAWFLSYYP